LESEITTGHFENLNSNESSELDYSTDTLNTAFVEESSCFEIIEDTLDFDNFDE